MAPDAAIVVRKSGALATLAVRRDRAVVQMVVAAMLGAYLFFSLRRFSSLSRLSDWSTLEILVRLSTVKMAAAQRAQRALGRLQDARCLAMLLVRGPPIAAVRISESFIHVC